MGGFNLLLPFFHFLKKHRYEVKYKNKTTHTFLSSRPELPKLVPLVTSWQLWGSFLISLNF